MSVTVRRWLAEPGARYVHLMQPLVAESIEHEYHDLCERLCDGSIRHIAGWREAREPEPGHRCYLCARMSE